MDENKDYVHFMVRHANGKALGWIAPVEQPDAGPTGGSYVVPLTRNGRFSKQYQVDFARYSGDGQRGTTETTIVAVERFEGKYLFVLQVAGQSITLQENPGDTALNRLKYVGQLSHPDFASTLVEIEAVPEDALDDLFTRTGYVLIGCDPWTKYVGIDNLPQGEPPNKPSDPNGEPSIVKALQNHAAAVHEIATRKGPINPIQFAHSVCDEFLRYLFSAFPLSDPELADQARQLLERPSSLDIPLVKGPFVSLSESFAKGEPIQKLASAGLLHPVMPGLIGYPTMYLHQQQVFEAVKAGQQVLVATGTGSGKTESFLYPIVDDLLRQRDKGINSGLAAILVYPMNALANDQLDRLRDMLGGTGITFGQWVGTTADKESDVVIERFDGSSRTAFIAERKRRREEAAAEDRAVRLLAPPEECCSEEDIRERQPRILLTNYRQLEVLATRLPDVTLFADAPLKYLVFDEAHTYSGANGAEVACLIRRLRALAGKTAEEITCIGTSATLSDPTKKDADNEETARRFASRFFGVDSTKVKLVGESYVTRDWPKQRYKPIAPPGDGMSRLGRVLNAITEPVKVQEVKSVIEEITGQIFEPGKDWQESLFDHLVSNEYVYQTTQILRRPKRLNEAAWQTSQRLAMGRLPEGDQANAELLCYLVLVLRLGRTATHCCDPRFTSFCEGLTRRWLPWMAPMSSQRCGSSCRWRKPRSSSVVDTTTPSSQS